MEEETNKCAHGHDWQAVQLPTGTVRAVCRNCGKSGVDLERSGMLRPGEEPLRKSFVVYR